MPDGKDRTDAHTGEELCGLIVKLEKDILWSGQCGDNPILGYFDHIGFQQIRRWLEFSPRTTAVELDGKGLGGGMGKHPLSMYPIKLLFPEQAVMDDLKQEAGLGYDRWRGDIDGLLEENPCLTVLLVNLTDKFKDDTPRGPCEKGGTPRDPCGKQLRRFVRALQQGQFLLPKAVEPAPSSGEAALEAVPYSKEMAGAANLCIMPSLGYSDYCILLAEKDWSFAPALIEFLHRAAAESLDGTEAVPILSTDYVVPAYHMAGEEAQSSAYRQGIRLSMRIHLRPGAAMPELKRAVGEEIEVYQLSGSSDCMLESKSGTAFNRLLGVAMADNERGSGDAKEIRNLVISTEAALQRAIPPTDALELEKVAKICPSTRINRQIKELRVALQGYWEILRDENLHMRQFNSMWDRVTAIESICREPHNDSLQLIMVPWLEAFTECLNGCVREAKELAQASPRDVDELWRRLEYIDDVLETFIDEAGSLLADLSRSDCFSMESERYNHASVSSATALLIAYNRWQNSFVEDVLREDPENRCKYAFLVRSGGCDTTTTKNIFYAPEPEVVAVEDQDGKREVLKESMPLVTQMSEMSLFDCSGTVLRMTHECMHYCGERLRKPRIIHIIGFAARYFGQELAQFLFSGKSYPEHMLRELKDTFLLENEDLSKAVWNIWKSCAEDLRGKIAGWLDKQLKGRYHDANGGWDEQEHMSDNVRQWMLGELTALFYPYCPVEERYYAHSPIVDFLYKAQLEAAKAFYEKCDAEVRKYSPGFNCLALDRRRQEGYLDGKGKSGSLVQAIILALDRLLMDPVYGTTEQGMRYGLGVRGLSDALEKVVFDCFSECFADIEACMRLGVGLSDYLLGFVFEDWNVERAMPMCAPYTFRIPAVLRVCFRDELECGGTVLGEKAQRDLAGAVECLARHGMPESRKNAPELIRQANQFLMEYKEQQWVAGPLEEYLQKCRTYYGKREHPLMEKYQKAFQQIRLFADGGGGGNATQLFTNLITIGEVDGVGKGS